MTIFNFIFYSPNSPQKVHKKKTKISPIYTSSAGKKSSTVPGAFFISRISLYDVQILVLI